MSAPSASSLLRRQNAHKKEVFLSKKSAKEKRESSMAIVEERVEKGENRTDVMKELGVKQKRKHHKQENSLRNHHLFPGRAEKRKQNQNEKEKEGEGENQEEKNENNENDDDGDSESDEEEDEEDPYDSSSFIHHAIVESKKDDEKRLDKSHIHSLDESPNQQDGEKNQNSNNTQNHIIHHRSFDPSLFSSSTIPSSSSLLSSSVLSDTHSQGEKTKSIDLLLGLSRGEKEEKWKLEEQMGKSLNINEVMETFNAKQNPNISLTTNSNRNEEDHINKHKSISTKSQGSQKVEEDLDDLLGI